MLETVMPRGPAKAPEVIVDRTLTLDPADIWPDPLACPDWPLLIDDRRYDGPRGRHAAEDQLERIGRQLNSGAAGLRAPTDDERDQLFARTFARGATSNSQWQALGLRDIVSRDRTQESLAELIVMACHLRGYLRKLDAQEVKAAEDELRREREQAQRSVDGYARAVTNGRAELDSLAEAVARHEQRLADEKAFRRAAEIRQTLGLGHSQAVQAARKLGIDRPAAPRFD